MLRKFPAKVLLLGEYTILNGSKALALPFKNFEGQWSTEVNDSKERILSIESMRSFLTHGSENHIDLNKLKADVNNGLWFDSSIPHGYGLGSSGALIAAIFDRYALKRVSPLEDKMSLARLEDYFHGSSSGLDPFVSLIQKPLLIHSFDDVEVLENEIDLTGFFLLNSGKPRQTGPLVSIYQDKMKDPEFSKGCADVLARDVNLAVSSLVKNEKDNLFHYLWHISKFQWEFFPEMIPTNMRGIWSRGLESGEYVLKLCGAGGGGFLLGYSEKHSPELMQTLIPTHEISGLR